MPLLQRTISDGLLPFGVEPGQRQIVDRDLALGRLDDLPPARLVVEALAAHLHRRDHGHTLLLWTAEGVERRDQLLRPSSRPRWS